MVASERSLLRDLAAVMFRPRRTIRAIIESGPDRSVKTILFLAIISAILDDFDLHGLEEATEVLDPLLLGGVFALGIVIAVIVMVLAYYVLSAAATATGRWMGGTGEFREVRAAIAWGLAPVVWALAYRIPALIVGLTTGSVGPPRVLVSDGQIEMSGGNLTNLGIGMMVILFVLDLLVICWYFILASNTLGEAHRFSAWKGFATLFTAFILPFATVALLILGTTIYLSRIG